MLTENPAAPLILLVEDDPGHANAIQRSFEYAVDEYRLLITDSLRAAREAIDTFAPALVLTDYRLPDGDGSELARLAADAWPVILMTAKGSEQIAVKVLKAGVQDYVVKSPETFTHMPETVNHSLRAWGLIQARKQAEDALRDSEERHRLLYERLSLAAKSASFGVWEWDISSDTATWDDTMYDIYGIPRASAIPLESWIDTVFPGDVASILSSLKSNIDKGGREAEFRIIRPDGEERHIYSAEGFIRDEHGQVVRIVGVNTDITKRKQAEETLRSYARRLIEMEEDLRRKIATELHDEIGRDLTVLGMNFSMISSELGTAVSDKLLSRIEDSSRLIEGISRTARTIMAGLIPPVLVDYGLHSALLWHSELFSARTGITVTVDADESFTRLPADVELALFRISQEALMNTAKHAGATAVSITLEQLDDAVLFTISDNGAGFRPQSVVHRPGNGWGMTIMRERAELVGGSFSFTSLPGHGTRLTVTLPQEAP